MERGAKQDRHLELYKLPTASVWTAENPLRIVFKDHVLGGNFILHKGGKNELAISIKEGASLSDAEKDLLSYCDKLDRASVSRSNAQSFSELSRLFSGHIEKETGWRLSEKSEFTFELVSSSLGDKVEELASAGMKDRKNWQSPPPFKLVAATEENRVLNYLNAPMLSTSFQQVGDTLPGTWATFPRELAISELSKRKEAFQLFKVLESVRTIGVILKNIPQLAGQVSIEIRNSMARQLETFANYTAEQLMPLTLKKIDEALAIKKGIRLSLTDGFKPEAIKAKLRNASLLSTDVFPEDVLKAADKTATEARFFQGSRMGQKRQGASVEGAPERKRTRPAMFSPAVRPMRSISTWGQSPYIFKAPTAVQSTTSKFGGPLGVRTASVMPRMPGRAGGNQNIRGTRQATPFFRGARTGVRGIFVRGGRVRGAGFRILRGAQGRQ